MSEKQEQYGVNHWNDETLRVNPTVSEYVAPKRSGLLDHTGRQLVHKQEPVGFVHFDRA